jgi:putative nucleotidyltransferase with HDIG domain
MSENKYVSIDKSIIAEGCAYDFALFYAVNNNKQMKELKPKGVFVDEVDLIYVEETEKIFVKENEHHAYEDFYKNHLSRRLKKGEPLKSDSSAFSQKLDNMYENASVALNDLFENPQRLSNYKESKKVVNELVTNVLDAEFTIKSLMKIATHDYYTHTHSINVAIYALSLGNYLSFGKTELEELGEAALLHDLGKSKIHKKIINKNGKLTAQEFELMKSHPVYGANICFELGIKKKNILDGIKHHHEKKNGAGYPDGLSGSEIPLYAMMIGICDIFDALTSKRSYKEAMTSFEALMLMKTQMKDELDIKLLKSMILMFK